jgi:ribosomal protein S18 acetylase RimI-like enzyme
LFVAPDARGRGLAASLLAAASAHPSTQEWSLVVDVVVDDDDRPAVALYEPRRTTAACRPGKSRDGFAAGAEEMRTSRSQRVDDASSWGDGVGRRRPRTRAQMRTSGILDFAAHGFDHLSLMLQDLYTQHGVRVPIREGAPPNGDDP